MLQVNRPARYIGREWNLPRKDFSNSEVKFALVFPDLYEIGMSNLGVRIIYSILNSIQYVSCERFFSCAEDMENILRSSGRQMLSLESGKELREFDMIGFSLASELDYTNVLNVLELGSVPLKSSLRGPGHPLIIGGGPCVLNPEPMHDFFDLFVIGEAEGLILELVEAYRKHKEKFRTGKISKEELMLIFSQIEGVYVPSLYEVSYGSAGGIEEFRPRVQGAPRRIKKRLVEDLDHAHFPSDWLVPYIQIIHDRITIEVMRGCPNRCRFCQARTQYFPFRQKSVATILNLACQAYRQTGYEELSLGGLSVSDYPHIEELLQRLVDLFRAKAVSISLPSIKAKGLVGNLSGLIAGIKKTTLTFAPEAGTKKLRDALAKDFQEEEFFRALEESFASGYQHVKLYFMTGLPMEEEDDLDGIIDLSNRVSELRRKIAGVPANVNISIGTLIPKPHTPLQWSKMQDLENIKYKQDYLKSRIKNRRLRLSFHNRYMSFLEGVLSRGDRRLSRVIYSSFRKGAKFDAWDNHFNFEKWQEAFRESGIDPNFYLKARLTDEFLPWDFIDTGIDKDILLGEFKRVGAEHA